MKWSFRVLVLIFLLSFPSCTTKKQDELTEKTYLRQTVLSELFTNVYCHNCGEAEGYLDSVTQSRDDFVSIEYHMYFGNFSDSMYLAAKTFCDARWAFYQGGMVMSLPICYFDGVYRNEGIDNIDSWGNQVLDRLSTASPCSLAVTGSFDSGSREGELEIQAIGEYPTPLWLRIALTESEVYYAYQNVDTLFNNVLRQMFPNAQGTKVNPPETVTLTFTVDMDWNLEKLRLIVFLQDDLTKEIVQALSIPLSNLEK